MSLSNVRSWERLSSECRKIIIKVPVIITANQRKENFTRSKWDLKLKNTIKLPEARENAGDYEANGVSFIFDWLREWRAFSDSIVNKGYQGYYLCRD